MDVGTVVYRKRVHAMVACVFARSGWPESRSPDRTDAVAGPYRVSAWAATVQTFPVGHGNVGRDRTNFTIIMTKADLNTLIVLAAMSTGLTPVLCYAYALDAQLDCKSSAHVFIAPLLNDQYIDPTPMRVEANSVNAFRTAHDANLTAFGFRVYAVLGYQQDDEMFKQGSGQPIADSGYGAVVLGPADAVEARAREAGSDAVVRQVVPLLLTAIFCNGH